MNTFSNVKVGLYTRHSPYLDILKVEKMPCFYNIVIYTSGINILLNIFYIVNIIYIHIYINLIHSKDGRYRFKSCFFSYWNFHLNIIFIEYWHLDFMFAGD